MGFIKLVRDGHIGTIVLDRPQKLNALSHDLVAEIFAAPAATFAVTPARLGVPYNVSGMMTFMSAASLRVVKELAFTAAPISAERAERIGIASGFHIVQGEKP